MKSILIATIVAAMAAVGVGCQGQHGVIVTEPPVPGNPLTNISHNTVDYTVGQAYKGPVGAPVFNSTSIQTEAPSTPQLSVQPDSTQPSASVQRIIIYSGKIDLVVADINSTIESIRQMAISAGGYLQDMDSHSITIRVPAAQFEQAVSRVEKKGEVTDRQIKAADVTEQMRDLNIRLENAEQTRQRLLKLLELSGKIEDTVKIEEELEKVTEQVELIKGKIRFMQLDVAYSLLHVQLNSPAQPQQQQVVAAIPFPWVRGLGQGVVSGNTPEMAKQSGIFSGGVGFDLPPSYVCFYQQDDLTEAMSAEGVMIKVQRHDNYKGGDVKFWSTLAHRSLVENQSMAITRESDAKNNPHARYIEATKDIPGKTQGYLLMVAVDGGHVYVFEAWGAKEIVSQDLPILEKSAESVAR